MSAEPWFDQCMMWFFSVACGLAKFARGFALSFGIPAKTILQRNCDRGCKMTLRPKEGRTHLSKLRLGTPAQIVPDGPWKIPRPCALPKKPWSQEHGASDILRRFEAQRFKKAWILGHTQSQTMAKVLRKGAPWTVPPWKRAGAGGSGCTDSVPCMESELLPQRSGEN